MADDDVRSHPGPVGPGTPQAVAVAWVEAVMERKDLLAAWPITDPTLRLVLVQDWVWTHRHHPQIGHGSDWDEIARNLAACPPLHPLWDQFASEVIELWQKIWRDFDTHRWSVWDQPEVLGLDLEMVSFVEPGGVSATPRPGRTSFARRFAVRHTEDGWKIAGVNGEQMFVPGWPPSLAPQSL